MKNCSYVTARSIALSVALLCVLLTGATANGQPKLLPTKRSTELPPLKSAKPARPAKQALIVLLENGGISSSLKVLMKNDLPKIPVAKCKGFSFEMKKGESIPQLIARVFSKISKHPECLNPANWTIEMVPMESVLDPVTDFLIEEMSKVSIKLKGAESRYHKVVVMQNNFTAAGVIAQIRKLAPDHVIDIHVLSHGGTGTIIGTNGAVLKHSNFFKPLMDLRAARMLNLHLRTVYQLNCRSGTLVQSWRNLGAQAVNGTDGAKNNYLPHQYIPFLDHWLAGKTFGEATNRGYQTARTTAAPLFLALQQPSYLSDSRLLVTGGSNLKVTSK